MHRRRASRFLGWFACVVLTAWSCGGADTIASKSSEAIAIVGTYQLFNVDQHVLPYDLGHQTVSPSGSFCDLIADSGTLSITDRGDGSADYSISVNMHAACGSAFEPLHASGGTVQAAQSGTLTVSNGQVMIKAASGTAIVVTSMSPGNGGGIHVGADMAGEQLGQYTMVFTK